MKTRLLHDTIYNDVFRCTRNGNEFKGVELMEVSYKKLWKILIDKDMKKKDLQSAAGISWTSVTKLSKGDTVSLEVLMKICKALECNIGDIMDLIPEDENEEK